MPDAPPAGKSPWRKTPTANLVRYWPKGTYYLQGRFGGSPVRECLHTDDYRLAKIKLVERMRKLRQKAGAHSAKSPDTIPAALAELCTETATNPALKASTRTFYFETINRVLGNAIGKKEAKNRKAPIRLPDSPLHMVAVGEMLEWWSAVATAFQPAQANQMLMVVRQAIKRIRKALPGVEDPTEGIKRVRIRRTRLELLTRDEFSRLLVSIRSRRTMNDYAANWLEFMAYSGCRPGEIAAIEWKHIGPASIEVWGGGEGTKGNEMRHVPIVPAMAALLDKMRAGGIHVGKVFHRKGAPREALQRACKRLGLAHQRIYDLRHLFATTCIESGVDVPTIASWLGHKDGGALAMRTYVQNRDEHRVAMAAKVKFG